MNNTWTQYLQYAQMDEVDRLSEFLKSSLEYSTPTKFSNLETMYELGYAADYMNLKVQDIKQQLTNKIPILALYDTYSKFGPDNMDFGMTDVSFRTFCTSDMYTDQLILSAMSANIDIRDQISVLWKRFLTQVVLLPNTQLPDKVSQEIFEWVIKQRCQQDVQFLKHTKKDILQDLFGEYVTQPLNAKQELCSTVADLNIMAKYNANKSVHKCKEKLYTYKPNDLGIALEAYTDLKEKFSDLSSRLDKWDDVTSYHSTTYCDTSSTCSTDVQRLRTVANAVKRAASACDKEVDQLYKKKLAERRKSGDKSLSFSQMLKSYF